MQGERRVRRRAYVSVLGGDDSRPWARLGWRVGLRLALNLGRMVNLKFAASWPVTGLPILAKMRGTEAPRGRLGRPGGSVKLTRRERAGRWSWVLLGRRTQEHRLLSPRTDGPKRAVDYSTRCFGRFRYLDTGAWIAMIWCRDAMPCLASDPCTFPGRTSEIQWFHGPREHAQDQGQRTLRQQGPVRSERQVDTRRKTYGTCCSTKWGHIPM